MTDKRDKKEKVITVRKGFNITMTEDLLERFNEIKRYLGKTKDAMRKKL